jgi:hypothetical protein
MIEAVQVWMICTQGGAIVQDWLMQSFLSQKFETTDKRKADMQPRAICLDG